MSLCTFYISVYTSARGEATCDELWFFIWLSLFPFALLWCCQYVKGTKQILIAQCVVEFSRLHLDFIVGKLQIYTVHFTVVFCKRVYSFSVFLTTLFWQPQLPKLFYKNYRFFVLQCRCADIIYLFISVYIYCIGHVYWKGSFAFSPYFLLVENVESDMSLDTSEFQSKFGVVKPSLDSSELVFHCQIGRRGAAATEKARSLGFKK